MSLAEELKQFRKKHGISQSEFANSAGILQTTVCQIEKELVKPAQKTIDRIYKVFNNPFEAIEKKERVVNEWDIQKIIELREQGLSFGKIGQIYNLDGRVIFYVINKYKNKIINQNKYKTTPRNIVEKKELAKPKKQVKKKTERKPEKPKEQKIVTGFKKIKFGGGKKEEEKREVIKEPRIERTIPAIPDEIRELLSDEDFVAVYELLEAGEPIKVIAEIIDCQAKTVLLVKKLIAGK
jgi:DNA-binding XRE family transcriptional regulator